MTRRDLLSLSVATAATAGAWAQSTPPVQRNLGGAPAGFPVRTRIAREQKKPFDFVEHCHSLGLGVVEARLDPLDPTAAPAFRKKIEAYGMRGILDFRLPRERSDVDVFDTAMKAAREAGAISLRAALTQRRYEQYPTFAAFQQDFEQCQKIVALAEPVLAKYKVRLGLENHKGWRAAEQAAWMKRVSSEWVGVHYDFGNNLALCETPMQSLELLKPYTFACHIKDMAVEPYADGFLLSEVPLGEGLLDIPAMVKTMQAKDPNMPFSLEMITRDPLKIPIFTDRYWATFDDSYSPLPGRDLARIFDLVRKNKPKSPLPHTSGLSDEEQLKLEDSCIQRSIAYARQNLKLG